MNTKSLLLTAVLTVAGAAGAMAQSVYSQNIVGYVSQVVPQGYSIVANQMNGTDNKISTIFDPAKTPDNTTVFKFNRGTGGYLSLTYIAGAGWFGDDDQMTLAPGESVWISAPSKFTNTFVGEVKLLSTNALQTGYQIVSSVLPKSADLDTLTFPQVDGITIYQFNPTSGGYLSDTYIAGAGWFGDTASGTAPTVNVGQGFWVYTPSNTNWVQTMNVGP